MVSVTVKALKKRFGAVRAVDGVSVSIGCGEFFFLLGPSGCGKTTLLRMLAGFCEPDGGDIFFGERRINPVPAHRRNTGMVFQNYALWPHMTVWQNVAYGLQLRRMPKAEVRRRTGDALEMVRLGGLEGRRPNALSGGQQQRVALARALVIAPDALLLDEPLSNLDAKLRVDMRGELRRIHKETGITTIYVTHDQKEALSLAQRVAVMKDGKVEQVGTPREVYLEPANRFVAEFIGQANVLAGEAEPAEPGRCTIYTPFGTLLAQGDASGPVLCCIRPEALVIGEKRTNQLWGNVTDVTYLGDQEQVVLRLQSDGGPAQDLQVMLHHPRRTRHALGERLAAGCEAEDVRVVPG